MSANSITLIRIMLSVVVVVMFGMNFAWRMAAVVLTFIVFHMDSLNGYVALKLGILLLCLIEYPKNGMTIVFDRLSMHAQSFSLMALIVRVSLR